VNDGEITGTKAEGERQLFDHCGICFSIYRWGLHGNN
jgi:hypothetical protein